LTYDFTSTLLLLIALTPAVWYLGLVLTNGLRRIPVLAPIGRILGAVCYLAAGAGGLALASAVTMAVLAGLIAGGSLLLLMLVPLLCLGLIMGIILEPLIARSTQKSPSTH
jgi:hypothetical protein